MVGALFSVGTAGYTICAPMWGYLADRGILSKTKIIAAGPIFLIIGYSFMGPLPFLPYEKYYPVFK